MNPINKLDIYVLCLQIKRSYGIPHRTIGSWNYYKIMVDDSNKVIIGGHNLYGAIYLHKFLVFEVFSQMK